MEKHLERYHTLLDAIEAERSAEEAFYNQVRENKSIHHRVQMGVLWSNVKVQRKYHTIGELLEIEVERRKHLNLPHKFKAGISAIIFADLEEREQYKGVISYVQKDTLRIMVGGDARKEEMLERGEIHVELIYDPRPYMVMRDSIHQVIQTSDPFITTLRKVLAEPSSLPTTSGQSIEIKDNLPLNDSQKVGLEGCLNSETVGIIHGPPGTGKTTTLVQLIRQIVKSEKKVLVCAPSNNAVDHIAKICDQHGLAVLRIGNVTRIGDHVGHLTLAERTRHHAEWKRIKKVKIEAENARHEANKYKRSFGEQERRHRTEMYREARELRKWARELEDRLIAEIFQHAQVICTTLVGAASDKLDGVQFGTVIIDEASQALEPECWAAILKAKRVILAGDHLQLPPTVKSNAAMKLGLNITMLDILADQIPQTYMLKEQYRMHDKIVGFSNAQFYKGQLISNNKNATWTIKDDQEPITLIDTSGCGYDESFNPEHKSYCNPEEWSLIEKHIERSAERYAGYSIGIISPYAQQVRHIRNEINKKRQSHNQPLNSSSPLSNLDIEVNSIDGFQGQEKDIIYISLVRSNPNGKIGFLSDQRRLNVAMTRAKMKLVIIGDLSTVATDAIYEKLGQYVEENGMYDTGWSYMEW